MLSADFEYSCIHECSRELLKRHACFDFIRVISIENNEWTGCYKLIGSAVHIQFKSITQHTIYVYIIRHPNNMPMARISCGLF